MRFRLALAFVVAAALAASAFAVPARAASCDVSWASPVSGGWNDGSKWSGGAVPTSTQNVCITVSGTYTVTLTGPVTVASLTLGGGSNGQTLAISTSRALGATLALGGNSSNSGTLELTDSDSAGAGSAEARVLIGNGATLTNSGAIVSDSGPGAQGTRVIDGNNSTSTLVNAASGTITVNQDLQIDTTQSGLFTTSGNITIASGEKLLVEPSGGLVGGSPAANTAEMDIDGGTITDNGTFAQGISESGGHAGPGALKVNGGTITGGGLIVVVGDGTDIAGSGVGASFSGAGSGKYTFVGGSSAAATTLAGTIGANQTVALSASAANGGVPVHVNSDMTNDGTIELTDSDTSGSNQNAGQILLGAGVTLNNAGKIVADGLATAGLREIDGSSASSTLDNTGEIDVDAPLELDPDTGTFTTGGTINVQAGETLRADPNGAGGGMTTFNLNGGQVTDSGTLELGVNTSGGADQGATFNVNGGTVTGNPIIAAVTTTTFSGNGSGSFMLAGATSIFGGGTIAGTIGPDDTVTMSGSGSGTGSAGIQTSGDVINDGTFTMTDPDTTASTSAFDELNVVNGSTFTNAGTMIIDPGPDASGYRSIDGTLDNTGTLKVNMLLQMALHAVSGIDNSGTVQVGSGQGIIINGGSDSYTQSAGTTSLGAGATLSVAAVVLQGGTLSGSGSICGPGGTQSAPCGSGSSSTSLTSAGTIAPGPTPSTLTVYGSYTQASGGTLAVGINSGGHDQLAVTGSGNTAALDGTLQVTTASGFTPSLGEAFQILTAPSVSGQFATTTGLQSGPYEVSYNATNVKLTATTPTPGVSFNPTALTFGSAANTVAVGATVGQTLTVTSSRSAPLSIGTLSLSGPQASSYSLGSDQCSGQTVQPGSSCTVSVSFSPSAPGSYAAAVNVPDNASGSPQQVSLNGTAGAAGARITFSAASLQFGLVGVGAQSAPQTVTVTSTGSAPLTISSTGLSGADAQGYKVFSDSCAGSTLGAGASCTTEVTLTPAAAGPRTARLAYTDNAPGSPQTISLAGTGTTTGVLSGHVVNGAVAGGPPVRGAAVEICHYPSTGSCQSTSTAADGSYSISGLTPGSWKMDVSPPQPYLLGGTAIVQIAAGQNSQDFSLTQPQSLPPGVTIDGQGGNAASSFWTSPDAIQAPLDADPSGTPGYDGVSITTFSAGPGDASGVQPSAFGRLEVEFRYDSAGVPRFVAMLSVVPAGTSSLGSWTTSLTSAPTVGEDVRGLTVQGVFTPSPKSPLHGLFDYTITHSDVFWNMAGASPAPDVPHQAPGTGTAQRDTLIPTNSNVLVVSNPSNNPCPPGPTYGGKGSWNLPGVGTWSDGLLERPDGSRIVFYYESDGTYLDLAYLEPNSNDANALWATEDAVGEDNISAAGPQPGTTSVPGVGLEVGDDDLIIAPDGNSFIDTSPGSGPGRYIFHRDGSLSDTWTGTTYAPTGNVLGQSTPSKNCGGGPNPPGNPPTPNDPNNGWKPWQVKKNWWKDPSGKVTTTSGIPVAKAKVVLLRSAHRNGPFNAVPRGSIIMSPGNRRNPYLTSAFGSFGWDVLPGFYRVTAQHAGCTAAGGGAAARTKVLTVPPAVVGLNLVLRCPHLRRTASRTKLSARRVPVDEVVLMAVVRGRHPQGLVKFMRGGRVLGVVPLGRTGRATLAIAGKQTKGIRAIYEGDGYNAPSSGAG